MKHNHSDNSKLVIGILVLIIILLLVGIVGLFSKQSRMSYQYAKSNQVKSVKVEKNNLGLITSENNSVGTEKIYKSSLGSFSYNGSASIIPNKSIGVINVGKDEKDPYIESIVFISDADETPAFYDNADYQSESIGKNNFESFENTEAGYKHFVLVQGKKAISVTVKAGGPRYVDLGSISF